MVGGVLGLLNRECACGFGGGVPADAADRGDDRAAATACGVQVVDRHQAPPVHNICIIKLAQGAWVRAVPL